MQYDAWENEYKQSQLVTLGDKPQNDVLRFLKWLDKEEKVSLSEMTVLDLGCGTGRNSNYLSELGNEVTGLEISRTALSLAKKRDTESRVNYIQKSIGESYSFPDQTFDLILDITSSNSLDEKERSIYLRETYRVLKDGGHFLVRALCKDGDKNAKNLIKISPGKEHDTYIMKELNLTERVFSLEDFRILYSPLFEVRKLMRRSGYTKFRGRSYKRNYLIAYLQK